ncbi:unnamed protein product [Acanthoscelides obtectus]|uniref:Uncharacterized protein n=1 Tax=Acanthoscelides obtectus TaxID=200917 RepID=A0A9P0P1N3_ACAOB|nr:unnamed protein product [Acanthoscelides obtectus]CAK1627454.1 hypothetical protein AOBTE_LOCUS4612 [Acanthoscelides obtectus]
MCLKLVFLKSTNLFILQALDADFNFLDLRLTELNVHSNSKEQTLFINKNVYMLCKITPKILYLNANRQAMFYFSVIKF